VRWGTGIRIGRVRVHNEFTENEKVPTESLVEEPEM